MSIAPARLRLALRSASNSFAFVANQPVASVSVGPPCGGLYLTPSSHGGSCAGVMKMLSTVGPGADDDALFQEMILPGQRRGRHARSARRVQRRR